MSGENKSRKKCEVSKNRKKVAEWTQIHITLIPIILYIFYSSIFEQKVVWIDKFDPMINISGR